MAKEKLITVVSVCNGEEYDWQSALDYRFESTEECLDFIKLTLSQGLSCFVYDKIEPEEVS